jgi:hypothetical protein
MKTRYAASAVPSLITQAAARAGRDAEQRELRRLLIEDDRLMGNFATRDAEMAGRSGVRSTSNYSFPPAGSAAWEARTLANDPEEEPFFGSPLPRHGEQLPPEPAIEASVPIRYGAGTASGFDRRRRHARDEPEGPYAAQVERDFRASGGDEGGYLQPMRSAEVFEREDQGVGFPQRNDPYSTLDWEPVGPLPSEHQGGHAEHFFAADLGHGQVGIFKRGDRMTRPIARFRGEAGDCRIVSDRTGRLGIIRRRVKDRLHALKNEADRLARHRSRDSLGQERQLLRTQNEINREFWRRPQTQSDFWGRR